MKSVAGTLLKRAKDGLERQEGVWVHLLHMQQAIQIRDIMTDQMITAVIAQDGSTTYVDANHLIGVTIMPPATA